MFDIAEITNGSDMVMRDTAVFKAANVCSIQLGALEYAPDFGVDLKFFVQSDLQFQNESFKSYLVERLIQSQVNVNDVTEVVEKLNSNFLFNVGDNNISAGGLVR